MAAKEGSDSPLVSVVTIDYHVVTRGVGTMATVGVRELKAHLSQYLKRVGRGERIVVTERGRPVAVIGPAAASVLTERLEAMLRSGMARWAGGKPRGSSRPVRLRQGPSVADAIVEDRR